MRSPLKKVRARRGAATLGRSETALRLVRRATRSRSDPPGVHRRDLGFDKYGAQTRTLSARPKVTRRRSARPLQDGYARRRPAPSRPRGAKALRPADQRGLVEGTWKNARPPSRKATSSSWTICRATRDPGSRTDNGGRSRITILPPDSPDMNPIEKAYSKLKAFLRKIANEPSRLLIALDACADILQTCGMRKLLQRPADMIPVDRSPL